MSPPIPEDERERLRALARYAVLDSDPEERFDELTLLASEIFKTPIALVSLVDENRQWFKSRVGLDVAETPRELAFCAHAIVGDDDVMVVSDATADPRFVDNPLVTGAPDIRFYAGAPLVTNDGYKLGTLCVIDREPREPSAEQLRALRILGRQVIDLLELRTTASELARRLLAAESQARRQDSDGVDGFDGGSAGATSIDQRDLIAHITHDLRTPLNAILGLAEYLGEDEPVDDAERRDVAGRIGEAGGYMLRLVDDILDLARIDADRVTYAAEEVDLVALARSTFETVRPLAAAEHNVIRLSGAPEATLRADPTRIRQVLLNLLSNACKYTKDGTIRMTLAGDGDAWIRIDVTDSGIGMDDAQCRSLFRPFAQVQEGGRQAKGTGLGLHITRALCERMGGAIAVESTLDVGTTFWVWLPRSGPEVPPCAPGIVVAEGGSKSRALVQRALGSVAPLTYMDGVAEVLWSMVDRRWRAVVVDASASEAEEIELVRALVRAADEQGITVVVVHDDDDAAALRVRGVVGWRQGDDLAELAAHCR